MWGIDRRKMFAARRHWILTTLLLASLAGCSDGVKQTDTARLSDLEARSFINAHSCNACHEINETRIGPAFRDVAVRYDDRSEARIDQLAQKIMHGGAGAWGNVPMVSSPKVAPGEAQAIARWILELEEPQN